MLRNIVLFLLSISLLFLLTFYFFFRIPFDLAQDRLRQAPTFAKASVRSQDKRELKTCGPPSSPTITLKNLSLHEIENNHKTGWHLQTATSALYKANNAIECHDVTCTFLSHKKAFATLTANYSSIDRNNKNVFLKGLVQGNVYGVNFSGENTHYSFTSRIMKTKKPATYSHKTFSLTAQKSVIDAKEKKMIFTGGITSEFFLQPDTQQQPQQPQA